MDLQNIGNLITALVIFEAVKMGLLIIAAYCWLFFQEKNEK